jgi:hypothetical protein
MAAADERIREIEPDDGTKMLCRLLVRRLQPRARRGELELRFELEAEGDVGVKELILKERFSANELAQFDRQEAS